MTHPIAIAALLALAAWSVFVWMWSGTANRRDAERQATCDAKAERDVHAAACRAQYAKGRQHERRDADARQADAVAQAVDRAAEQVKAQLADLASDAFLAGYVQSQTDIADGADAALDAKIATGLVVLAVSHGSAQVTPERAAKWEGN